MRYTLQYAGLVGGALGATSGALALGGVVALSDASSVIGPARAWAWIAVLYGGGVGGVARAIVGAIVWAMHVSGWRAIGIGIAVGFLVALWFMGRHLTPNLATLVLMLVCMAIGAGIGGVVGWRGTPER